MLNAPAHVIESGGSLYSSTLSKAYSTYAKRNIQMADVILYLVNRKSFSLILNYTVSHLIDLLNKKELSIIRPQIDSEFHRDFDVDIEGDILEIFDKSEDSIDTTKKISDINSEFKNDLILLLAKWSSVAQWSCWDARLFLYVEPFLEKDIISVDEFLEPKIWHIFQHQLSKLDQRFFTESIVLDWMSRREKLGETMEPSEDPKILPTMNSHNESSQLLFNFIKKTSQPELDLMIGRDYLNSELWHLGKDKISSY